MANNAEIVVELKARFGDDLVAANLRNADIMDVVATLQPETKMARDWLRRRTYSSSKLRAVADLIANEI